MSSADRMGPAGASAHQARAACMHACKAKANNQASNALWLGAASQEVNETLCRCLITSTMAGQWAPDRNEHAHVSVHCPVINMANAWSRMGL